MTARQLLADLEARQIVVRAEGTHLRFRAPRGALTTEHRTLLAEHKAEILAVLREAGAVSRSRYPLSYNQLSIWLTDAISPAGANYHIGFAVRVRSELDVDALRVACQGLVDRHAVLRTTYRTEQGEPIQEVRGHLAVDFTQIDATDEDANQVMARVVAEHRQPFDLERGPVFRARLFRRAATEHVLLVSVHHIAADGWSSWMLLDELRALYRAARGAASTLPVPAAEYPDFVRWQRDLLESPDAERHWSHWRAQCATAPAALELPADRPRPAVAGNDGASRLRTIAPELADRLRALARSEGTTLYTVLLAAFHVLLHRYTGQDEIVVGSPSFGRSDSRFDKVVGHFVNMLPLRGDLSGNPTFRSFLSQMRTVVLEGIAHQDYPFALMVERLGRPRDPSRFPLFQAALQLQQAQQSVDKSGLLDGDLQLEPLHLPQQDGQFDVTLDVTELGGVLHATLKYRTDLFDASTIDRMHGHLETLLAGIAEDPDRRVAHQGLLTPAEREQVLVDWNRTEAPYPLDTCLHELIEAQVGAHPRPRRRRVRGPGPHLPRARPPRQPARPRTCAPAASARTCWSASAWSARSSWSSALARHPQGRRRLRAARPRLSRASAWPSCSRTPGSPVAPARSRTLARSCPPSGAQAASCSTPAWDGHRRRGPPARPDAATSTSEHLAYVIYTSGSTGRPKGAMNTHRGDRQPPALDAGRLRPRRRRPRAAEDAVQLRRLGLGVLLAAADRRPAGRGAPRRPPGRRLPRAADPRARRSPPLHFVPSMLQVFLEEPGVEPLPLVCAA